MTRSPCQENTEEPLKAYLIAKDKSAERMNREPSLRWRFVNCQDCTPSIFVWLPAPQRKPQWLKRWAWICRGSQARPEGGQYPVEVKPMPCALHRTGGLL